MIHSVLFAFSGALVWSASFWKQQNSCSPETFKWGFPVSSKVHVWLESSPTKTCRSITSIKSIGLVGVSTSTYLIPVRVQKSQQPSINALSTASSDLKFIINYILIRFIRSRLDVIGTITFRQNYARDFPSVAINFNSSTRLLISLKIASNCSSRLFYLKENKKSSNCLLIKFTVPVFVYFSR